MHKKTTLATMAAWLALSLVFTLTAALAADNTGGTSAITGRVQNVATGQYLTNARVTVHGTELTAFTDQTGTYRLAPVPSGVVVVDVAYTGLDPQKTPLTVLPGQTVEQNFSLTNRDRYGDGTVKMDSFLVSTSKVTEGESLATNEQRNAANIKNVVSADAYGDVSGGNIAEFLKYLPGLSLDLESGEAISVSVRGMGSNYTAVSIDGAQAANTVSQGQSRTFQFKQIAMNNASRIELYKVPTPANPADSLAGSVNIVSKSAFERSKASFSYRLFLEANGDELSLKKQPFPRDRYMFTVLPGADFDATVPVGKNLGFVFTGLHSLQFVPQNLANQAYNTTNTSGTGGSIAKPYLATFTLDEAPRRTQRDSFSARMDWRIRPTSVLSFSAQASYYHDNTRDLRWAFTTGTTGTSTIAGGTPFSFGEDFTRGATGRGTVTMSQSINNIQGASNGVNARYRFDDGLWQITSSLGRSFSKTWRRYNEFGNFNSVTSSIAGARVNLLNINEVRPGTIQVFDNANQPIDYYDLRNYRTTGADGPTRGDSREVMETGDFNARRNLPSLPFPAAIQVGGFAKAQTRDVQRQNIAYTYTSPDSDPSASRFYSSRFASHPNYYGFGFIPWTSPWKANDLWQETPSMFTKTLAQQVAEEKYRIQNSEHFQEIVEALYAQVDVRFFKDRLRLLSGARYERTIDHGVGPLVVPGNAFLRDAAGNFILDSRRARIRNPAAGAAGSLQEVAATYFERQNKVNRTYDGIYPSAHATYTVAEPLLVRLSFAQTYGRPDFANIVPNATITENDPSTNPAVPGTINIRNTSLRPWTANNYDLSVEYYSKSGGVFSAGVFRKDIKNFFGSVTRIATAADLDELGLDDRYTGFQITTQFNSGDARVTGVEANARHSLAPLGRWGRFFTVFANATRLELEGNQNAQFSTFLPRSANWGVTFSRKPVTVSARWTYRGEQRVTSVPAFGADAFRYWASRTQMDLSTNWNITNRVSFFANARNVFNVRPRQIVHGEATPAYAMKNITQEFGVGISTGVRSSF